MGATVTNYPRSVLDMRNALGFGVCSHGWLCDELSGNLAPVFGPDTLVASGTGIFYGDPGPRGDGVDRSVGFTTGAATGKFSAGNSALFDIATNATDLLVVWIGQWRALPSGFGAIFSKASSAFGNGWAIGGSDGTSISMGLGPGATWSPVISGTSAFLVGSWHAGISVIDRTGTDTSRIGVLAVGSSTPIVSNGQTGINGNAASSASNFVIGRGDWVPGNDNFRLAAAYVGCGVGVAAGLAANLPTALQNFVRYITRADNYKAKVMRNMLPPPYKRDFGRTVPNILTVIGQSDNLIGGLFGTDDFLPDEG